MAAQAFDIFNMVLAAAPLVLLSPLGSGVCTGALHQFGLLPSLSTVWAVAASTMAAVFLWPAVTVLITTSGLGRC